MAVPLTFTGCLVAVMLLRMFGPVFWAVWRRRRQRQAVLRHRSGAPLGHRCADCDHDPDFHRNGSAHQDLQEWR